VDPKFIALVSVAKGHERSCLKVGLFDWLVGAREQYGRQQEAERRASAAIQPMLDKSAPLKDFYNKIKAAGRDGAGIDRGCRRVGSAGSEQKWSPERRHGRSLRTLNAFTGRWKPLSSSSPTASNSANVLTSVCTLESTRIWPSRARSQSREARFATVPVAEY
jgi:hypothetical protein